MLGGSKQSLPYHIKTYLSQVFIYFLFICHGSHPQNFQFLEDRNCERFTVLLFNVTHTLRFIFPTAQSSPLYPFRFSRKDISIITEIKGKREDTQQHAKINQKILNLSLSFIKEAGGPRNRKCGLFHTFNYLKYQKKTYAQNSFRTQFLLSFLPYTCPDINFCHHPLVLARSGSIFFKCFSWYQKNVFHIYQFGLGRTR